LPTKCGQGRFRQKEPLPEFSGCSSQAQRPKNTDFAGKTKTPRYSVKGA